ncbi:MAG: hypothetical protein HZB16_06005 [Armatimonadetes bacterium]|nr:hypothetical protein [Armatimonadota bacterium]
MVERGPRHLPRWDQAAAVAILLLGAGLVGLRPGLAGQMTRALFASATLRQADRLAPTQPLAAASRWERLKATRPDDPAYQALVWSSLLDLYAAGNDAAHMEQTMAGAISQPAYFDAQPRLMLAIGVRHLSAGRPQDAALPLSRGVLRSPRLDSVGIRLRAALALAYERTGSFDATEHLLSGLVEECPGEHWLAVELARHWADRGQQLPRARALATRALRQLRREGLWQVGQGAKREDLATYLDTLGWVLFRSGQRDEAQPLLERALNLASTPQAQHPLNLYHLGELYFDRGLDSDALRCANRAVALDPTLTVAKLLRDRIVDAATRGKEPT